jgi:hypothetical protein
MQPTAHPQHRKIFTRPRRKLEVKKKLQLRGRTLEPRAPHLQLDFQALRPKTQMS